MKSKKLISSNENESTGGNDRNFLKHVVTSSAVIGFVFAMLGISWKINQVQTIPYLDEIYHVPQAQEYCRGNFSYVSISNV